MAQVKRPTGVCIDCWDRWQTVHDTWQFATPAIAFGFSAEWEPAPEPKLAKRPAPHPGPRCTTDHRAKVKQSKKRAHENRVQQNFGLPPGMYDALLEFQGGTCAILYCRAQGKKRALAVDHDHSCCPGPVSCGKCVRGLLCQRHNLAIGYDADKPEVFESMADYIRHPPYERLLQRGPQGEQLDRDTGAGHVQQ